MDNIPPFIFQHALQYAFSRKSYCGAELRYWIKDHWHEMTPDLRRAIEHDVANALGLLGNPRADLDDDERREWHRLAEELWDEDTA